MSAVFISHAKDDSQQARALRERLAEHGIRSVFLAVHESQGIDSGDQWEQKLYRKLRTCRALVALNSRAYAGSKWCFTEIAQAKALNVAVFPVRIDDSDIHELIRDRQAVDLTGPPADVADAYGRLARGLQAAGVVPGGWDPQGRPPYPGLNAFEAQDAPVFFGRDAAIAEALGMLELLEPQGKSWLLLIGASGSGKSSLLRAGVLPQLENRGTDWIQVGPLIPGADPWQQLALAVSERFGLLGTPRDWKACRELLESGDPRALSELAGDLRAASGRPQAVVLLAVDQLEEVLSLPAADSSTQADHARFVERLRALADHPSHSFVVVATLRADFLGAFQSHGALRGVTPQKYVIDPISTNDLRQVIEKPAQLAGVAFEAGLVDEIIRETETADALPLLAFALRELYDGYADDGLLESTEYRKLGGLANSVAVAATRVMSHGKLAASPYEFSNEQRREYAALRLALLSLVRLGDRDQPVRRPVRWDALPADAHALLARFVDARLLVSTGDGAERELRVAHEALFRSWPTLAAWIETAKDLLAWRRRTGPLLEAWERSGKESGSLLRGAALGEAVAVRDRDQGLLTIAELAFVVAGERQQRAERERERKRARATVVSVAAVAVVVGVIALVAWNQKLAADQSAQRAANATALAYVKSVVDPTTIVSVLREARGSVPPALESAAMSVLHLPAAEVELKGHTGGVLSLAFSPDGKQVLTGSRDKTARVWNADADGDEVVLQGHTGWVSSVAFSPDGKRVLTGSTDETARLWNADGSGEPVVLQGHTSDVSAVAFSADGKRVLTLAGDQTVRVWNADGSGEPVVLQGHKKWVPFVAFSPDGKRVLTGSADKTARVWNADGSGDEVVLQGHTERVSSLAFSPDGKRVLTGSEDKMARVWNADGSGDEVVLQGHTERVSSLAFSPDGKRVLTGSADKTARVWNADGSGNEVVLQGHTNFVSAVAFSPDGKRVLTGSEDKTARVWNADGDGESVVLNGHTGWVFSVASTVDSKRVLTGSADKTARVWNADGNGEPVVLEGHTGWVFSVAFSPDGKRVLTGSADKTARVWNADGSGEPLVLQGHTNFVSAVAFSPDGKRVLTGSADRTARVWNADGSGEPLVLQGHTGEVSSVAFSPDGKRVLTGSRDKTARVWNADGSGESLVLKGHTGWVSSVAFSPDGKRVLTGSTDETVRVWNADGGDPVVLPGHKWGVSSVAFSPEGKRVLVGSRDKTARVWNADGSGDPVVLPGHTGDVSSVAFSADGKRVLTGSWDRTARLWEVQGWRTALWRKTRMCLPATERSSKLGQTPEQAQAGFALCQKTVDLCRPILHTPEQCEQAVLDAYGPLESALFDAL